MDLLLVLAAGAIFSARWNWWRRPRMGFPILLYHRIGRPPRASRQKHLWVKPETLRKQLLHLLRRGYEPIAFADLEKPLPARPFMVTFDDGYLHQYELAFPILRQLGVPAVFFISAGFIGKTNGWHDASREDPLPLMDWSHLEELRKAGMEIGSHGLTHADLTRLPPEKQEEEISESRRMLEERLGQVVSFAHPYGAGAEDAGIGRRIAAAGYRWACSARQGIALPSGESRHRLPRVWVWGNDTWLDFLLKIRRGRSRF